MERGREDLNLSRAVRNDEKHSCVYMHRHVHACVNVAWRMVGIREGVGLRKSMSEGSKRLQKHRVALGWPLVDAKKHTWLQQSNRKMLERVQLNDERPAKTLSAENSQATRQTIERKPGDGRPQIRHWAKADVPQSPALESMLQSCQGQRSEVAWEPCSHPVSW